MGNAELTRRKFLEDISATAVYGVVRSTGLLDMVDTDPARPAEQLLPAGLSEYRCGLASHIQSGDSERQFLRFEALDRALRALVREARGLEPSVLEPVTIEGVRTYGVSKPLDQLELDALAERNNREFAQSGERLSNDTYYATIYISDDLYKRGIPIDTQNNYETPQSFFTRHFSMLDELLQTAGVSIEFGELIVFQSGLATPPQSGWFYYDSPNRFFNRDGVATLASSYNPLESAYQTRDGEGIIDRGLLHEFGHWLLYLGDRYAFDYDPFGKPPAVEGRQLPMGAYSETDLPPSLIGIPKTGQKYFTGERNDEFGNSLMDVCELRLSPTEKGELQQRRREGSTHNLLDIRASGGIYFRFIPPKRVVLELGSEFGGKLFKLYRTAERPIDGKRILLGPLIENRLTSEGRVDIGNPFSNAPTFVYADKQYIPASEATLLYRVDEGKLIGWRWETAELFTEQGRKGFKDVILRPKLALLQGNPNYPNDFNWHTDSVSEIYFPLINHP